MSTLRRFSLFVLIVTLALSQIYPKYSNALLVSNDDENVWNGKIIIDAGHGGFDGGAEAIDGTKEKDINLIIASKLKKFCQFSGFEVIMTRETDDGTEKDVNDSIANRKKSDMRRRLNIVLENQDAVFVSIHLNKFTSSSASGAQVFYSVNNPNSEVLADKIQNSIISMIQPDNDRTIKKAGSSIFLMDKSFIPSVIVECGFLSNSEDLKLLKQEEYQSKLAYSIFCGILEYN